MPLRPHPEERNAKIAKPHDSCARVSKDGGGPDGGGRMLRDARSQACADCVNLSALRRSEFAEHGGFSLNDTLIAASQKIVVGPCYRMMINA